MSKKRQRDVPQREMCKFQGENYECGPRTCCWHGGCSSKRTNQKWEWAGGGGGGGGGGEVVTAAEQENCHAKSIGRGRKRRSHKRHLRSRNNVEGKKGRRTENEGSKLTRAGCAKAAGKKAHFEFLKEGGEKEERGDHLIN
jgi:hypothetical protein